jgi:hypothetical protein
MVISNQRDTDDQAFRHPSIVSSTSPAFSTPIPVRPRPSSAPPHPHVGSNSIVFITNQQPTIDNSSIVVPIPVPAKKIEPEPGVLEELSSFMKKTVALTKANGKDTLYSKQILFFFQSYRSIFLQRQIQQHDIYS